MYKRQRYATDRIAFAAPAPVLSPATEQVVGIPTWLAVTSPLEYAAVSAEAGPVWATVRPEFRDATWRLGADTVVCTADVATRWNPLGSPDQSSACTHTFSSSATAPATATVTVTWRIWQRSNEAPTSWTVFGEVALTSPVALTVTELEATIG